MVLLSRCAPADVVGAGGSSVAVGVSLTRLGAGELSWRVRDGANHSKPIAEIEYLQITGWDLFNMAEKQLRDGQAHRACQSYEKALAEAAGGKSTAAATLDRALVVRWRLLRAYGADRRLDRAAALYIELLERSDGPAWQGLAPRQFAAPDSPETAAAARIVDAAIARHAGTPIASALRDWRARWPAAVSSQPSLHGAMPSPSPSPPIAPAPAAALNSIAATAKKPNPVAAAGSAQQNAIPNDPAETWFRKGQALLARVTSASAVSERRRAGLAFMRVVIHYPDSPLAPEALYLAGRVCRDEGNMDGARTLWSELVSRYAPDVPAVQSARQELSALAAATTAPADR